MPITGVRRCPIHLLLSVREHASRLRLPTVMLLQEHPYRKHHVLDLGPGLLTGCQLPSCERVRTGEVVGDTGAADTQLWRSQVRSVPTLATKTYIPVYCQYVYVVMCWIRSNRTCLQGRESGQLFHVIPASSVVLEHIFPRSLGHVSGA